MTGAEQSVSYQLRGEREGGEGKERREGKGEERRREGRKGSGKEGRE